MALSQTPVKLISKQQIQELRNVLECLLPTSVQVFNCVVLELLEDGVERDIMVNKEFSKDNLNMVVFDNSEKPRWKILMFSNPEQNDDLKPMLVQQLDFTKPLLFGGLTRFQQEVVQSFYGERQAEWASKCHIVMDWNGSLQDVTAADSCRMEEDKVSCSYTVDKLSQEHAVIVNNSWKFKNKLSLQMLEGLIQQEKLLGLFIPGVEEPVAWITIYSYGSMGMLHTQAEYRRQGCAKYLVRAAKEYARGLGLVPYVHVEEDNQISANFFEKLGFVKDQYAVWMGYK